MFINNIMQNTLWQLRGWIGHLNLTKIFTLSIIPKTETINKTKVLKNVTFVKNDILFITPSNGRRNMIIIIMTKKYFYKILLQ